MVFYIKWWYVTLKTYKHITEGRSTLQRSTQKCLEQQSPYTVSASYPSTLLQAQLLPVPLACASIQKALLRLAWVSQVSTIPPSTGSQDIISFQVTVHGVSRWKEYSGTGKLQTTGGLLFWFLCCFGVVFWRLKIWRSFAFYADIP